MDKKFFLTGLQHEMLNRTFEKPFKRIWGESADVISLTPAQRVQAIEDARAAFTVPWSTSDVYDVTKRIKNAKGETIAAEMRPKVVSDMINKEHCTAMKYYLTNSFIIKESQKYIPNAVEHRAFRLSGIFKPLVNAVKFIK